SASQSERRRDPCALFWGASRTRCRDVPERSTSGCYGVAHRRRCRAAPRIPCRPRSRRGVLMNIGRPYTLIAELTYDCPLRCAYCSNPIDLTLHSKSMDTATWVRVFREAEELGVVQVHFTGGEPLLRKDLELL